MVGLCGNSSAGQGAGFWAGALVLVEGSPLPLHPREGQQLDGPQPVQDRGACGEDRTFIGPGLRWLPALGCWAGRQARI